MANLLLFIYSNPTKKATYFVAKFWAQNSLAFHLYYTMYANVASWWLLQQLSLRLNLIGVWICQSGTFILCFQIPSLEKTHIQFWQEKLRKDGRRKSADERNAQRSAWTLNNFAKEAAAYFPNSQKDTHTFDHQPKRIGLTTDTTAKEVLKILYFFTFQKSTTSRKITFISIFPWWFSKGKNSGILKTDHKVPMKLREG